jgi:hypothetical protein
MSNSIKLSPKHGLNPCIPVCFFCGKEKNEIALMGQIGDRRKGEDFEAPMKAVLDFVPCEECQKKFAEGVLIIEVTSSPEYIGMPIAENAYPTGRYVVVKPEALVGDYKAGSKALCTKKDFIAMFGHLN